MVRQRRIIRCPCSFDVPYCIIFHVEVHVTACWVHKERVPTTSANFIRCNKLYFLPLMKNADSVYIVKKTLYFALLGILILGTESQHTCCMVRFMKRQTYMSSSAVSALCCSIFGKRRYCSCNVQRA